MPQFSGPGDQSITSSDGLNTSWMAEGLRLYNPELGMQLLSLTASQGVS
jgi:hypothetical protein